MDHENNVQQCRVGDHPEHREFFLFADASFAGGLRDSKSTSGAYLELMVPRICVPPTWMCKKQGPTAHSSVEAELIVLDVLRIDGLISLMVWDEIMLGTEADSMREVCTGCVSTWSANLRC